MSDSDPKAESVPLYDVATDRERIQVLGLVLIGLAGFFQTLSADGFWDYVFGVFFLVGAIYFTVALIRALVRRRAAESR